MEGGGGVTFLKLPFAFALSTKSKQKLFLIHLITRRLHLVKSLQTLGRQSTSDKSYTAIMADTREELIMQFVELTGTSPGKVKPISPNHLSSVS